MNGFSQDVRFALRQFHKNPAFAFTVILVLAVGICANIAIFAFVDSALIKPLPYANPNRLVFVTESVAMIPEANLSYPDYLDWKAQNKVFSSLAVDTGAGYLFNTPGGVEPVQGVRVSDNFFKTLGIAPALGRDFYTGEDLNSAPQTVILSYESWQKRFGGRKGVIGQAVTLNDISFTIVGVLPKGFAFAPRGKAEFWTTMHASNECDLRRSCHALKGIARLKDGVTVQAALADAQSIAKQLEIQYPGSNQGQGAYVTSLAQEIVGNVRPILLVLLAGVGLLFLIACVNVASLLLVRAESRKREIAVRGALGASSARLIRQFVTEGLILVGISATVALLAAYELMHIMLRLIAQDTLANMPYVQAAGINTHVVLFTLGISLLTAVVFSITPIARVRPAKIQEGLTQGGRGFAGTGWRQLGSHLVTAELAIAVVLLVGAGLLGKSFYRLLQVDIGFEPDHLAVLNVNAPDSKYGKDPQAIALERQIIDRVSSLPGVKSIAIASNPPVSSNGNTDWIRFVGKPYHGEHNEANERDVSAGYFSTIHARLLRGRYFSDAEDSAKPRVVIINEALAKKYFPGEDPIGKRIGNDDLAPNTIKEIIGVVSDIREGSLDSEIWPAVYYPFNQSTDDNFSLIVRTAQDEQAILPVLSATVRQIDPSIATYQETTIEDMIHDAPSTYLHRSSAWLVGGFASLAFFLGVFGLYGVVAYSVRQRTREIGVRMALGAQRGSIYRMILSEAGKLAVIGIVVGTLCSLAAGKLLGTLLFGVSTHDVATLSSVAALLAISALLASYLPARRAAKVDPMVALRYE